MTATARATLAALAAALGLAGCGGGLPPPCPDGACAPFVPSGDACLDLAREGCRRLDACRARFALVEYGSLDLCIERQRAACVARLAAHATADTADTVTACAAAVHSASCAEFVAGAVAGCRPPPGPGVSGAPCRFDAQCASGYCGLPGAGACGACAERPAAGSPCPTGGCGPGLDCRNGRCAAPLGEGAPCRSGDGCGFGLACIASTCRPPEGVEGAACAPGTPCDANRGLSCAVPAGGGEGRCAPLRYTDAGACGTLPQGETLCTGGARCAREAPGSSATTCVPPLADGAPCAPGGPAPCLRPARCVAVPGASTFACQAPGTVSCGD